MGDMLWMTENSQKIDKNGGHVMDERKLKK
jgi:hypothetical protein